MWTNGSDVPDSTAESKHVPILSFAQNVITIKAWNQRQDKQQSNLTSD